MEKSKLIYPDNETNLQQRLNDLFTEWFEHITRSPLPDNKTQDDLVIDGFYPHYTNQKSKVLFIGREGLDISGENYIDVLYRAYTIDNTIGDKSLNQAQFHALMLYITYGLNNNYCSWEDIPSASEIAKNFTTEHGVSFAFMNISKFSNDSGNWQADWNLINGFIDASSNGSSNYFSRQIELLHPDIILTMNLESLLNSLGQLDPISYGKDVSAYKLHTAEKEYLLIDMFHFSAVKSQKDCFYSPLLSALYKYQNNL